MVLRLRRVQAAASRGWHQQPRRAGLGVVQACRHRRAEPVQRLDRKGRELEEAHEDEGTVRSFRLGMAMLGWYVVLAWAAR